ncbi:macrophage mannose receptor 1-like [Antedon mediterranea]|uniref:macrophage mannose receptor 1-like n=1 Tax=Antedon mediterranea TaxID=105859 RepID=UPI003AF96A03
MEVLIHDDPSKNLQEGVQLDGITTPHVQNAIGSPTHMVRGDICTYFTVDLIDILTEEESLWILQQFAEDSTSDGAWIANNDIAIEGYFQWLSGISDNYTHWYDGEPNQLGNEDCAVLHKPLNGAWHDISCAETAWVALCDKWCPTGWHYNAAFSKCYWVTNASGTWNYTRDMCTHFTGDLIEISTEEESLWILERFAEDSTSDGAWIAYNDIEIEGYFQWLSGMSGNYTHWYDGEPNQLGNEDCAVLHKPSNGAWHDISCAETAWVALCDKCK